MFFLLTKELLEDGESLLKELKVSEEGKELEERGRALLEVTSKYS